MQIRYLLFFILLIPTLALAVTSDFNQGVEAFKKGDYEKALACFKRSEDKGLETPNLQYNLGVVYFRLGHYDESKRQFQSLAKHPDWRPLALYNLGVIAEAGNNLKEAIFYYTQVSDTSKPSKIKQLSALKRRELKTDQRKDESFSRWHGLLSASVGYDDNIIRVPDSDPSMKESDVFSELYAFGSRHLKKDKSGGGYRIDAGLYSRLCAEEKDCNYLLLMSGINHEYFLGNEWRANLSLLANADFIEKRFYTTTPIIKLGMMCNFNDFNLTFTQALSWVEPGTSYDYLRGTKSRTALALRHRKPKRRIQTGYIFEYNNRKDLEQGEEFFSYSPLRHKMYTEFEYNVTPDWTAKCRGEFYKTVYQDANRELDGTGSVTSKKRDDHRLVVSISSEYELVKTMVVFVEYSHIKNDSNMAYYDHKSNQAMLGFQKAF